MTELRGLPSVDKLLQSSTAQALCQEFGRELTLDAIRQVLEEERQAMRSSGAAARSTEALLYSSQAMLQSWCQTSLLPVINASGVVLHTNLGRAPLSTASLHAMQEIASGYCTLEYDLPAGQRGHRDLHAEALLTRLSGGEAALVVNNNAAAVLLALSALARRRRVIIGRGQLIEIGGGFRIPDIMAQSGARVVEIGTTNRTHLSDYATALDEPTALILRAHPSNFRILGFTSEPTMAEIVALAHQHQVPVLDDLGSGCFLDTAAYGLPHEPTIAEALAHGSDLVCFSGDKLLGGPQAGILIGRRELIAKIRKHPLARAMRPDKLRLAALNATLLHYLKGEAVQKIPIWRMIATPLHELQARASAWQQALGWGEVQLGLSTIGGGSLPEETLPTALFTLRLAQPNGWLAWLRAQNPPIIARIEAQCLALDPRTVLPEQEAPLLRVLADLHTLHNSPKGAK